MVVDWVFVSGRAWRYELGNVVDGDAKVGDRVPKGMKYVPAPMPFWMRLTSYGIGMHGGLIPEPGKPASHGCIRLPHEFAEQLFELTERDSTLVVVADDVSHDASVTRPGDRVPVNAWTGQSLATRAKPQHEGGVASVGAHD